MPKRTLNRLTARSVETLKSPGWHADGGGLYLRIDGEGRRRWVFVYFSDKRRREMGLGPASGPGAVALAEARKAAQDARGLARTGTDPLEARAAAKAAVVAQKAAEAHEAALPCFGTFADEYVEAMRPSWRNTKHATQWAGTFRLHCAPIRALRIDNITTDDVLEVLKPIWATRPETARRVRSRIENVLDAARAKGHRTGENPARWRGHLDRLLPRRLRLTRRHHKALPYEAVPEFMAALHVRETVAARLLEFTILTAARSGEAIGARWEEFDLERAEWMIPAERMKAGRPHRVPLSLRAVAIVEDMARAKLGPFVFPGQRPNRPLSTMAMPHVLRRMGRADVTVHGFRSSFRDWAAELSTFPHEVAEMALAHVISNKAEAAYRRGDLFEKRRALMTAWAAYCEPTPANVVALTARRPA